MNGRVPHSVDVYMTWVMSAFMTLSLTLLLGFCIWLVGYGIQWSYETFKDWRYYRCRKS